jgi:phage RecT family recombinase
MQKDSPDHVDVAIKQIHAHVRKISTSKSYDFNLLYKTLETQFRRDTRLLQAERPTLLAAVGQCVTLALYPNTEHKHCWLRPIYDGKNKLVQFIPGYQGYVDIIMRSSRFRLIQSNIVYENEFFDYEIGIVNKLSHKPIDKIDKRGPIRGVYTLLKPADHNDDVLFKYMTALEINEIKSISLKTANEWSMWNNDSKDPQKWMWKKTTIRQLGKELSYLNNLSILVELDNYAETGGYVTQEEGNVVFKENGAAKHTEKSRRAMDNMIKKYKN